MEFDTGFLTALSLFGIGEASSNATGLPDINKLVFVNCAYYSSGFGEGSNYLNDAEYVLIFSSIYNYVPKKGGIVIMCAYQLEDWDYDGDEEARAIMKITVDNKIIFENEITEFFAEKIPQKPRAFSYQSSFKIEAKRINLTNGMTLELYQTMIIGYR